MLSHEQSSLAGLEVLHECNQESHRCVHKCPDCKSFCNNEVGHEGYHESSNHRNKDSSKFVRKIETKTGAILGGAGKLVTIKAG